MGKDSKPKESGGKGKGKQAASGSDENASKGKGKGGKGGDGLGTCTYVKGKQNSKIQLYPSLVIFIVWFTKIYFLAFYFVQLGIFYVRNKVRSMKPTRSCKMVGSATEIRSRQLSLPRYFSFGGHTINFILVSFFKSLFWFSVHKGD